MHPLHGNPYSLHWHQLMGISLACWLATSMWDFLLFCLLHTTPIIIFYSTHSAISMAHAHVLRESWKKFEITKVWNNCLACHRGCAWWEHFCVTKIKHNQTIWFCRDKISLAMLFWEDIITLISMLEVLLFFMSIWTFVLNLSDLNMHTMIKKIYIEIMLSSIPHQKFIFIIYLPEDERELSLGMLDTSPTYL